MAVQRVQRVDVGTLRSPQPTPEGFLRAEAYLTRTGVFEYEYFDGSVVRELRHPDDVFEPGALASFGLLPLTDDHPPVFLDATNARAYAVGTVGEQVSKDDDHVRAALLFTDAAVIRKLGAGKVELSCGYSARLEAGAGEYNGEKYDVRQRDIRGNHVALVDRGRAGPTARVRMDGVATMRTPAAPAAPVQRADGRAEEQTMKFAINGVTYDVTDEVAAAIGKERADSAAQIGTLTKERDTAAGELRTVANKLDAAEKAAPGKLDALVQARVALVVVAERHGIKCDGLSDRAVKVAVVEKLDGDKLEDSRSDDYVSACFDRAVKIADQGTAALGAVRTVAAGGHADVAPTRTPEQARAEMIARNRKGA